MKAIEYKTILDNIADGVFTVDSALRITSFNRSAEQITGVPAQEAIGRQKPYFCRQERKTDM